MKCKNVPNSALKIISSLPPSWKSVENSTNNKFLKLALIKLFESLGGKIQTAKYNEWFNKTLRQIQIELI